MSTKIIAEIGVNHNGSVEVAKALIDKAVEAGADAVKFQTFSADRLASTQTPKVAYQLRTSDPKETHYEMLKKLELNRDEHIELLSYCNGIGVEFCSTPYSRDDAELLDEIGVSFFKTSSADLVDRQLHEYIASTGKPCLVAVGMATLGEIEEALSIYEQKGVKNRVTLMHCVSSYPAPVKTLNLNVISTLKKVFDVSIGYSDHAKGAWAAVVSVALGATVIEKHFTLDTTMGGPDHLASSTPDEFALLVNGVRVAELALGDHVKRVQMCETDMRKVSRKSIVAVRDLICGAVLKESDLAFRRPGDGVSPMSYPQYIDRKLNKHIVAGEMITFSDLEVR